MANARRYGRMRADGIYLTRGAWPVGGWPRNGDGELPSSAYALRLLCKCDRFPFYVHHLHRGWLRYARHAPPTSGYSIARDIESDALGLVLC
jgi:hypothetical protein